MRTQAPELVARNAGEGANQGGVLGLRHPRQRRLQQRRRDAAAPQDGVDVPAQLAYSLQDLVDLDDRNGVMGNRHVPRKLGCAGLRTAGV